MVRSFGGAGRGSDRLMAWVPTLCLGLVVVLTLAYTIAGAIVRPNMYSDSGWGFVGWYTQARASAFNYSLGPDLADISREVEAFMSTWTPGQHVLPGLVEKLGMSLGLAIIVVVVDSMISPQPSMHRLVQKERAGVRRSLAISFLVK